MIKAKLNLTKLQHQITKTAKGTDVIMLPLSQFYQGEKGIYLDVVLLETPNSSHGDDYMAVKDVSKEEREKGNRGEILGNAKIFTKGGGNGSAGGGRGSTTFSEPADDDDLPF